jgi:D-aminopeptidase
MRARDLGIVVGTGTPGPHNAITDVPGVLVGHCTIVAGDDVRTGVTVVLPDEGRIGQDAVFAGCHRLNGNGEMTGLEWVREAGMLTTPIGLTNTHSVGIVRDTLVAVEAAARPEGAIYWALPVVAETWDGTLNDINGFHVRPEHVRAAMEAAASGPVAEGAVGSGTGMICHGFKGGIGTASRVTPDTAGGHTVGVLVQANHGARRRLAVNGAPVGAAIGHDVVPAPGPPAAGGPISEGAGSIIVIVASDAPLLPHQCNRLAQRAALGIARTGGLGEHSSGDLVLAFATGNAVLASEHLTGLPLAQDVRMLSDEFIDPYFEATAEATEEAIVNALVAAETTTGYHGAVAHALPHDRLVAVLEHHDALAGR